jgi:ABC-type sugar transport system ATPase subunit
MIRLENLHVRAGTFELAGLTLEIPTGSYAVLMGRTGSGKTTLLEAICGLRSVESGRIELHGRDVTRLRPADRGIGYVPQDRALFQSMSVRENLAFALTTRRWPDAEIEKRVSELAALLRLAHLLDRKPANLSGGEAQRVALGRALANQPALLVLDEPLSALDEDTRDEMQNLLLTAQQQTRVTALHVTHNRDEAARLGNLVFTLEQGRVVTSANAAPGSPKNSSSPPAA